jgi:hypothetical protein
MDDIHSILRKQHVSAQLFYADTVHDRIEKLVEEAIADAPEGSVAFVVVILPDGTKINAEYFGYQNPNFIVVDGQDKSGNQIRVLISHTAINVMIYYAFDVEEPPKRPIGFQVRGDYGGDETADSVVAANTSLELGVGDEYIKPQPKPSEESWRSYKTDTFLGLRWRWDYLGNSTEVYKLKAYCPVCDLQLDPKDELQPPNASVRFECDICHKDLGGFNETFYALQQKVTYLIERRNREEQ